MDADTQLFYYSDGDDGDDDDDDNDVDDVWILSSWDDAIYIQGVPSHSSWTNLEIPLIAHPEAIYGTFDSTSQQVEMKIKHLA